MTNENENKNIGVIKWLISLAPGKQIVAMLLLVIVTLFTPVASNYYSNKKAAEKCGVEKIELVQKYTNQIELIKDKQIEKLESEKARSQSLDSAIRVTNLIISKKSNELK